MIIPPFPDKRFMQMCWAVPDVKVAMESWTRSTGVGPFFYFESVPFEAPHYYGKPCDAVPVKAGMAHAGDIQIEVMAQDNDSPSFIHDVVPYGKTGLHHMALYCKDYDANLAAYLDAGAKVAFNIIMMGSRTCWLDTTAELGFMIELIEANPTADYVFGQFREAAQNWDGKDPVRTLG